MEKVKSGLQRFKSIESQSSFVEVEDISDKPSSLPHREANAEGHWWEIEPNGTTSEPTINKMGVETKNIGKQASKYAVIIFLKFYKLILITP